MPAGLCVMQGDTEAVRQAKPRMKGKSGNYFYFIYYTTCAAQYYKIQ